MYGITITYGVVSLLLLGGFAYITFKMTSKKQGFMKYLNWLTADLNQKDKNPLFFVDKTTIRLIRLTCIFIIFGGIFGALWRVSYVKNIEKERKKEFMEKIKRDTENDLIELCILNGNSLDYCEEEYKNQPTITTDKKLESLF